MDNSNSSGGWSLPQCASRQFGSGPTVFLRCQQVPNASTAAEIKSIDHQTKSLEKQVVIAAVLVMLISILISRSTRIAIQRGLAKAMAALKELQLKNSGNYLGGQQQF